MKRGPHARVAAVANPADRRAARPNRRILLQLWLAESPGGRIILHACCLLFRHGKWAAARGGIARGIQELCRRLTQWFCKKG